MFLYAHIKTALYDRKMPGWVEALFRFPLRMLWNLYLHVILISNIPLYSRSWYVVSYITHTNISWLFFILLLWRWLEKNLQNVCLFESAHVRVSGANGKKLSHQTRDHSFNSRFRILVAIFPPETSRLTKIYVWYSLVEECNKSR